MVFLGGPGTGKGTQAKRLSDRFGFVALSSGHLLRIEVDAGSDLGREAEPYLKSGALVPDVVITGVMLSAIEKLSGEQGIILDGFPRTVPQATALDAGLATAGRPIDAAIDFQMEDGLIVRRITGRRSCNRCGATYNIDFLPPKATEICDVCSERLIQRADDREDVVVARLATYRAQTAPLVTYYSDRGLLHTVDASVAADDVTAAIVGVVEMLDRSE